MTGQTRCKQWLCCFTGGETVDPETALLQRLYGPGQVGHLADGEMLCCTSRCLVDDIGNPAAAIPCDHHTLAASRIGITQNCPQVVRVGDAVQQQQEAVLAGGLPIRQKVLEFGVGKGSMPSTTPW